MLQNKINAIHKLSKEDWTLLETKWKPFSIKKNTFLTKKGNKENYLYFIKSGIARGYIETEGKQVTLGFAYNNDFTAAIDSFISGENTDLHLIAESDIEGLRISKTDLYALYEKSHAIERLGRLLMEMLLLLMSKQQIYYLTMSAEERYFRFMKQSSHLLQMLAQKHIASYLGMSAETFSRLRKKELKM
ncbi:MAG: Crp/Fnr family transcriptional regulator [Chitinophagales bacterium]